MEQADFGLGLFTLAKLCRTCLCWTLSLSISASYCLSLSLSPVRRYPFREIFMLGLQGMQPNSLQQQQSQQQSQQSQQQPQQNAIPPPPPQNGQDFTLSSVLHFLQTEWRRYERDRNEWEIERAEMRVCFISTLIFPSPSSQIHPQARIALLEGERRSFENVKLDLMRRIKMLEYALRVERSVIFHLDMAS